MPESYLKNSALRPFYTRVGMIRRFRHCGAAGLLVQTRFSLAELPTS